MGETPKTAMSSKSKIGLALIKDKKHMTDLQERGHLLTEQVNPDSLNLDQLSSVEFVELFNREDAKAVAAVARVKQDLAKAIDLSAQSLEKGGRLFYVGAGTSGRLEY